MDEATMAVAWAYRRAADALERGDHLRMECCGLPLRSDTGTCQHRPYHHQITCPDPFQVLEDYFRKNSEETI